MIQCINLDLFAPIAAPETIRSSEPHVGAGAEEALPEDGDQLDLFLHSDVEQAAARARRALQQLALDQARVEIAWIRAHGSGLERFARDIESCIEGIERRDRRWCDTGAAVNWIESELRPAAVRALAGGASIPVHIALRGLLAQADVKPFQRETAHTHRSYLFHLLGEHPQAIAALEMDPVWRSSESALRWHLELCRAHGDYAAELSDIAELCFEFPTSAEIEIPNSPNLATRWDDFCDAEPALPVHAFPAWCRLLHAVPFVGATGTDSRPGGVLLGLAAALAATAGANLAIRKSMHQHAPQLLSAWLHQRAG